MDKGLKIVIGFLIEDFLISDLQDFGLRIYDFGLWAFLRVPLWLMDFNLKFNLNLNLNLFFDKFASNQLILTTDGSSMWNYWHHQCWKNYNL